MLVNHNISRCVCAVRVLVEIPDLDVLLGLATAFVVGLLTLIIINKVRPYVKLSPKSESGLRAARLEEYERQLVEMKIRLDALGVGGVSDVVIDASQAKEEGAGGGKEVSKSGQNKAKITPKSPQTGGAPAQEANHITYHNPVDQVLQMVTASAKTSRDIQAATGKSREHTARLLKKLYDGGLVERNAGSRPYAYSITKSGKERLEAAGGAP